MPTPRKSDYVPAMGFRWLTPVYDTAVRATSRERDFKKFLIHQASVQAGQEVLDLASGTGTLAIWLKQAQPEARVRGIDGDPKIISIAQEKAQKANVDLHFDEGFSFDLPYAEAQFDHVLSSLFFHHLTWENKQRTAKQLFRVLKPGGVLHVADWGKPANSLMRGLFFAIQLLDGFETTRDNVAGRLIELFRAAGFENVEQTHALNTMFGTMAIYRAVRAEA